MRLTLGRVRTWRSKTDRALALLEGVRADLRACRLHAKGSDYSRSCDLLEHVYRAHDALTELERELGLHEDRIAERAIAKEAGGHRQQVALPPVEEW